MTYSKKVTGSPSALKTLSFLLSGNKYLMERCYLNYISVPESINSDHNTSPLFIFQIAKKTMSLKLMASLSLSVNLSPEDLGQAHDMFSRIFLNTNLRIFFLPNFMQ